jgi:hypothetical protein
VNNIRFLQRKEIDTDKWNELINNSFNTLPYALSWYLDAVAENWGALVLNDFEVVMPLVWLRKMAIKCVYQPYYCQQLGVFSGKSLTAGVHRAFLKTAAKHFPYIHINLNPTSKIVAEEFSLTKKKNLLLALDKDYVSIQKKYSASHRRNIVKANKSLLVFSEWVDLKSFQSFYLSNVNRTKENFKSQHEKIFKKLTHSLVAEKQAAIYTACNEKGNLLAAVLIVFHNNRLIGIINTSSAAGKKDCASHFLFDQIIKKFSNSDFILDFEGSSIASIARFYGGFGAVEEVFYNYKTTFLKDFRQRFS